MRLEIKHLSTQHMWEWVNSPNPRVKNNIEMSLSNALDCKIVPDDDGVYLLILHK